MISILRTTWIFGFVIYLLIYRANIEKYFLLITIIIMALYIKVYDNSIIKEAVDNGYKHSIIYLYTPIALYISALFPSLILKFTTYFYNTNHNFAT